MGVLVHPQVSLPCGAALPGVCFSFRKQDSEKNLIFYDIQIFSNQHGPNLLLIRGTTIKIGILTPVEFWWVP